MNKDSMLNTLRGMKKICKNNTSMYEAWVESSRGSEKKFFIKELNSSIEPYNNIVWLINKIQEDKIDGIKENI